MYTDSSAQVSWRSSSVEAGAVYKNSVRTARGQSENREELIRGESMQFKLQYNSRSSHSLHLTCKSTSTSKYCKITQIAS